MAKKIITSQKGNYAGTKAADALTVRGSRNTVRAGRGNDIISIAAGSGHKIYGEAGKDRITLGRNAGTGMNIYGDDSGNKITGNDTIVINGGKRNKIFGGKGADTFIINGGSSNYLYGGTGNDTFVIGKNSTGTAIVRDFHDVEGNTDKVRIEGVLKKMRSSGKNVIITGGRSGSLTLASAIMDTIRLQDNRGNYTVSDTAIKLGRNFKGHLNTNAFMPYIKSISGTAGNDVITVSGGSEMEVFTGGGDDRISVAKGNGHCIDSGKGNDRVTVSSDKGVEVFTSVGNDTVIINGGSGHIINSGGGSDKIYINKGGDHFVSKAALEPFNGSEYVKIGKDAGNNIEVLSSGEQRGDETIVVDGGSGHWIQLGNTGKQRVVINSGNENEIRLGGGTGYAGITVNGGNKNHISCTGAAAGTTYDIKVLKGSGHSVTIERYTDSSDANITVAAKDVTLDLGNTFNNSNNVMVEWSDQIGTLFIDTYKDFDSSGPDSYLTIKGANSGSFQLTKFTEVIYSDPVNGDVSGLVGLCLTDVNSPGCQIKISKWFSEQQFSGITFGNGEFLSYYDINAKFSGI